MIVAFTNVIVVTVVDYCCYFCHDWKSLLLLLFFVYSMIDVRVVDLGVVVIIVVINITVVITVVAVILVTVINVAVAVCCCLSLWLLSLLMLLLVLLILFCLFSSVFTAYGTVMLLLLSLLWYCHVFVDVVAGGVDVDVVVVVPAAVVRLGVVGHFLFFVVAVAYYCYRG